MRKSDTNIGPTTGPPRVLSIGYVPILRPKTSYKYVADNHYNI